MKLGMRIYIVIISTLVSIIYRIFFGYLFAKHKFSIGLLIQQFGNMVIEPVALQLIAGHVLGPRDVASADSFTCPAGTLECLVHIPLGAWIEKDKLVAAFDVIKRDEVPIAFRDRRAYVEGDIRRAGMVDC